MRKTLLPAAFAVLALAACGKSNTDEPDAAATPGVETPAPPAASDTAAPIAAIPAALQGRWGMVPADCTSTRGDAKGLLTIDGKTLQFYESVGTLGQVKEHSDTHLRAVFAFTGEGMSWTREEMLDVKDNGKTLVRQEYGEDAQPGPLQYSKC
jgi:hypothetical protein